MPDTTSILKWSSNYRFIGLFLYGERIDYKVSTYDVECFNLLAFVQKWYTWLFYFKSFLIVRPRYLASSSDSRVDDHGGCSSVT